METIALLTDGQAAVVNFAARMLMLGLVIGFWSAINYLVMVKLKLVNGTLTLPWQSAITAFMLADVVSIFNRTIESAMLSGISFLLIAGGFALLAWTLRKKTQGKSKAEIV